MKAKRMNRKKCIVCGKNNGVKTSIMDGFMETGVFCVCPDGCHRKIIQDGVFAWRKRL